MEFVCSCLALILRFPLHIFGRPEAGSVCSAVDDSEKSELFPGIRHSRREIIKGKVQRYDRR